MKIFLYKTNKSIKYSLYIGILIFCIITLLYFCGILKKVDNIILDTFFRNIKRDQKKDSPVIILRITDHTFEELKSILGKWPWPKDAQTIILEKLFYKKFRPAVVCYNILFNYKDTRIINNEPVGDISDKNFAKSLTYLSDVILPMKFINKGEILPYKMKLIEKFSLPVKSLKNINPPEYSNVITPIELIMKSADSLGSNNINAEKDGITRCYPLFIKLRNKIFASLALITVCKYLNIKLEKIRHIGKYLILHSQNKTLKIPIDKRGCLFINYYGAYHRQKDSLPFKIIDFLELYKVITKLDDKNTSKSEKIKLANYLKKFKNKILLIDIEAAGLIEFKATPVDQQYPVMGIIATVITNILNREYIKIYKSYKSIIISFFISFFVILYSISLPIYFSILFTIFNIGIILVISIFLFSRYSIFIHLSPMILNSTFIYFGMILTKYYFEQKERTHLKNAFSLYVSADVVKDILKNPEKLSLGGKKKELTIFFSDLSGFTSISELYKDKPTELVGLLNEYLDSMTDIILKYKGTLDRYEGDAIFAFWNAPIEYSDHAYRACMAAIENQQALDTLRKRWLEKGLPEVKARIGISTSKVIVGNIGAKDKFTYTVHGPEARLCEHFEGANKIYGTKIIIGEKTYQYVRDIFLTRILDILEGENIPIYELITLKERATKELKNFIKEWEIGYSLYMEKKFTLALEKFLYLSSLRPNDKSILLYIERCRKKLKNANR